MSDQALPRLLIALLAVLFVFKFAASPRRDPNAPTPGRSLKPLMAMVVALAAYLLASRVHWYPATDGTGTP
jgi:hypothetical protein